MVIRHSDIDDTLLRNKIKQGAIVFAGNHKLKIYGKLHCSSGKRMKRENRVFFQSSNEARTAGYRPCGHCLKSDYRQWAYSAS